MFLWGTVGGPAAVRYGILISPGADGAFTSASMQTNSIANFVIYLPPSELLTMHSAVIPITTPIVDSMISVLVDPGIDLGAA